MEFEATFEAFKGELGALMARWQVAGAAVGVWVDGREMSAGLGVTSVEHPLPVTADTLFQIGSITKTFTATALMRLVEQDRIELDSPVRRYLPEFQLADEDAAAGATVRHLLTHTGDWVGDFFRGTGMGDDALGRYVADMRDLIQLAPLGSHYSYNNAGFAVAGRILEVVTGRPYEAALADLILEPLGLEHAFFDPADVLTHRFVVGHQPGEAGPQVARPWGLSRAVNPMGGLNLGVTELIRYARFHLGDGTAAGGRRLLSPENMALMQRPGFPTGRPGEAVGLSWFTEDRDGVRLVGHGGATKGQQAQLLLAPARRFALVVLTNGESYGQVTLHARRWALRHFLGVEEAAPTIVPMAPADLAEYVGRYSRPFQDVELSLEGGRLLALATPKQGFPDESVAPNPALPPFPLDFYGPDQVIVTEEGPMKHARGDFIRTEGGRIGWLRFGRLHVRAET